MSQRTGGISQVGRKPSRVPFCEENCGRRVWNYATGLCGRCDPVTRSRSEQKRTQMRAQHARRRAEIAAAGGRP